MALLADRVKETTTTTGTGTVTLAGAPAGFQSFNTAFANASLVYYVIQGGAEWEIGIGTTGTGTLARTQVLQSSNADALVPFSAGVKDVFCSYVADRAVTTVDAATLTNKTIDDYTNNVGANSTHFRVKATGNFSKGAVLKATGFNPGEQALEVAVVSSATDLVLGIAEQTLTTGQFGTAVVIGELFDVNTNGLTVGQIIYSNGSGGFTQTKPSSGLYQALGWVVRANTNTGVIAVNVVAPLYVETSTNTANTSVLRDGSGNFAAGTITATLNGAAPAGSLTGTTLAANVVTSSLTSVGTLTSGAIGTGFTAIPDSALGTISTAGKVSNSATTAASANTPSAIVARDGSGNFSAGTITASLSGTATQVSQDLTAGTYLTSTGTYNGSTARTFAVDATDANTASKVVARDGSGNFAAGTITATLSGTATQVSQALTAGTYLTSTGTFDGSAARTFAVDATDANTASKVVARDGSGNFSAGTITATLNGAAPAGSLSGSTLASGVTASSLTSVGTLSSLTVSGNTNLATVSGNVGVGTAAPGARLEVQGASNATELRLRSTDTTSAQIRAYVNSLEAGKLEFTSARALNIETAGSLRASIDASGNLAVDTNTLYVNATTNRVGIGTTSPSASLHVNGPSGVTAFTGTTFLGALVGGASSTNDYSGLDFSDAGNVVKARIASYFSGSGSYLQFGTSNNYSTGITNTAMSIDPSGNLAVDTNTLYVDAANNRVGVGTTSPSYELDIRVAASNGLRVGSNGNSFGSLLSWDNPSGQARLWSIGAYSLILGTNGTGRAELDASGNLGLGVTPSAWASTYKVLQSTAATLWSDGTIDSGFGNNAFYNGTNWIYRTNGPASDIWQRGSGGIAFRLAGSGTAGNAITFTQAMTLDASGRLMVGATTPNTSYMLSLQSVSTVTGGLHLRGPAVSGGLAIGPTSSSATADFELWNDQNGYLRFATNNTERARITSGGSLLVNTTAITYSSERFAVISAANSNAAAFKNDGGGSGANAYTVAVSNTASSGDNAFVVFATETSDTTRGSITYNRGGGVVAYNTTSDYRAKDVFGAWQDAGQTIDALTVYRGKMKGATIERPMLIAHEAQAVAPYCVTGEKDAVDADGNPIYQQMDHSVLVPLLIAEVQSLRARVAALEA